MAPDEKTKDGNRQTREGDERIAENILAREVRNQLADHAHAGQHHDVDGRMRIEPEQMLEEDRIAADRRIKDADMRQSLEGQQQNRDRNDGRAQNHDQAGRVV